MAGGAGGDVACASGWRRWQMRGRSPRGGQGKSLSRGGCCRAKLLCPLPPLLFIVAAPGACAVGVTVLADESVEHVQQRAIAPSAMFPQQLPAVTPRVVSRLALLVPQVSPAPGCWRTPCTTARWLPASSSWPSLRCGARLLVARVHQYRHNKGFLEHKHVAQRASSTETCNDICAMQ